MFVETLIGEAIDGPKKRYHHCAALLKGSKGNPFRC